jgi:ABC-type lipoprotein export system ATPase subunit
MEAENPANIYWTDEVETTALDCINLSMEECQFIFIMGPLPGSPFTI